MGEMKLIIFFLESQKTGDICYRGFELFAIYKKSNSRPVAKPFDSVIQFAHESFFDGTERFSRITSLFDIGAIG